MKSHNATAPEAAHLSDHELDAVHGGLQWRPVLTQMLTNLSQARHDMGKGIIANFRA